LFINILINILIKYWY